MSAIVVNKSPVDQFTLVHVGAGALAYNYGLSLTSTLLIGFAWDFAVEPELKRRYPSVFPYPSQDAPTHALIDALVPVLGWLAARWWSSKRGVA